MTRFGPIDGGRLDFTLNGEAYALDVPRDGRLVAGWAAEGNWPRILPGCLLPQYAEAFHERLGDPRDWLGLRACWKTVHALAGDIYGVPWWTAQALAEAAHSSWVSFGSWSVSNGFDPRGEPAHRIISAALAWRFARVKDEKEARRLEAKLFAPPRPAGKKRAKSTPGWTPAEQAAAFEAAMKSLGTEG